MDSSPGRVIRELRLALDMSQAEFARTAGWAPSTISRWERGRAQPSRLAFKIILAFAEERGVRYRPKPAPRALIPLYELGEGPPAMWSPRRGEQQKREACRPDYRQPPPVRIERLPPRPPLARPAPQDGERFVSIAAERPRWTAEASFRVSVGGTAGQRQRPRYFALPWAGIFAAGLCAVLVVGMPGPSRHVSPTERPAHSISVRDPLRLHASARSASSYRPLRPQAVGRHVPRRQARSKAATTSRAPAGASFSVPHQIGGSSEPDVPQQIETAKPEPAPPPVARLESVIIIGDTSRATFRTGDGPVTIMEGSWLGRQQVETIAGDRVTLVNPAGETRTVRLGSQTPLE
jgi:transcriptional regulator with XRE-family HTH domain